MLRLIDDMKALTTTVRAWRAARDTTSFSWRKMALMAGVTALCVGGFVAAMRLAAAQPELMSGGLGLVAMLGLVLGAASILLVALMRL
jgi:uncharacterized YccA/Bax inhibitor family protein